MKGVKVVPLVNEKKKSYRVLELEKRLAMERGLKNQLAEIERALEKYDKGTYGRCDICGQRIDPARLEALPQANLCLSCKAKNAKAKSSQG